jgi:hypothetical protein
MIALGHGDWRQSLVFNPLAVPLSVLACCTLVRLMVQRIRTQRFHLHEHWVYGWLLMLCVAWVVKMVCWYSE